MISARHYLIDLQQLQQINEETNQARFIKRIVAPDTTEPPPLPIEYNEYSYLKKNINLLLLFLVIQMMNQQIQSVK